MAFVFLGAHAAPGEGHHGLVGLRPLPRTAKMDHSHNHGGSWAGTPTYEEQKGNYPFVAENLDVVMGWLDGDFKTKRVFFEHYWGLSEARDDLDPNKNLLIRVIRKWEERGAKVDHILICREYDLAIQRGHKDAKPGPFKEDTRILYEKDFDDIRAMFKKAHALKLIKTLIGSNMRISLFVCGSLLFFSQSVHRKPNCIAMTLAHSIFSVSQFTENQTASE